MRAGTIHPVHDAATSGAPLPTKDRVKAAALALFLDHGYRGTSVREIAEANQVTVPALYYHFRNKDALLAAIVEPFADAGEALMKQLAEQPGPPEQFAAEALGGYYDVLAAHRDIFQFVSTDLTVRHHEVAGHRLAAQAARFVDLLTGPAPSRSRRLCALAAIGAIRRPLRANYIDPERDRAQVLAAALAAYGAVLDAPPAARVRSRTRR